MQFTQCVNTAQPRNKKLIKSYPQKAVNSLIYRILFFFRIQIISQNKNSCYSLGEKISRIIQVYLLENIDLNFIMEHILYYKQIYVLTINKKGQILMWLNIISQAPRISSTYNLDLLPDIFLFSEDSKNKSSRCFNRS